MSSVTSDQPTQRDTFADLRHHLVAWYERRSREWDEFATNDPHEQAIRDAEALADAALFVYGEAVHQVSQEIALWRHQYQDDMRDFDLWSARRRADVSGAREQLIKANLAVAALMSAATVRAR